MKETSAWRWSATMLVVAAVLPLLRIFVVTSPLEGLSLWGVILPFFSGLLLVSRAIQGGIPATKQRQFVVCLILMVMGMLSFLATNVVLAELVLVAAAALVGSWLLATTLGAWQEHDQHKAMDAWLQVMRGEQGVVVGVPDSANGGLTRWLLTGGELSHLEILCPGGVVLLTWNRHGEKWNRLHIYRRGRDKGVTLVLTLFFAPEYGDYVYARGQTPGMCYFGTLADPALLAESLQGPWQAKYETTVCYAARNEIRQALGQSG